MEAGRLFGKIGSVLIGASFLAACGHETSDLVLESGNRDLTQAAPIGPTEVGKSKSETFTFRNLKEEDVVIKQISGITKPFYQLDTSTCLPGELVPAHGTCTVVVTYVPTADARSSTTTLSMSYVRVKKPGELRPGPNIALTAESSLNCGATATLAERRNEGVNEATQRNQTEAAAGTAKGQSLTYDDGKQTGYQQGYAAGYDQGYKSAYQNAFNSGHAQGYRDGSSSYEANRDGSAQGRADGSKKGYADGTVVGDVAGYHDGYVDGSAIGYADGYADGQEACLGGRVAAGTKTRAKPGLRTQTLRPLNQAIGEQPPSPEQILSDPVTQKACVKQGFDATYSASSFQRAYEAAAAANGPYQTGLRDGRVAGEARGKSEGVAAGQSHGFADGHAQGYQAGYVYAFDASYQSAYRTAYDGAYQTGYGDAYAAGGSRGYYAGAQAGYEAGYRDGAEDAGCKVD